MRVFAKKSFEFKVPGQEPVTTTPLSFNDLPDWVVKDPLFTWTKNDGDIEVITNSKKQKEVEKAVETPSNPEGADNPENA